MSINIQSASAITRICDHAYEMILDGAVLDGMHQLHGDLNEIRSHQVEPRLSAREIIDHQVTSLIHQDPLTFHAFSKPRGYAGDAELLDYIYKITEPARQSHHGQEVYRYNVETGACRSVRARRQILVDYINRTAEEQEQSKIISIACGHLREALLSTAVLEGRVGEFIAVDQDPDSLALIDAEMAGHNIRTLQASVLQIITGRVSFSDVDLIYSAGLYDYLEPGVARKLTARMYSTLKPGGRMLIANFAPNLREIGYMETFMDWQLMYRNESDIAGVAVDIDVQSVADFKVFRDKPENLVFLEVTKG